MYNSSLKQFLKLFEESIDFSVKIHNPVKRVDNIIKFLKVHVWKYVNRGLFEKDKTSFILMICFKLLTTAEKITNNDISLLLKAGASIDAKSEKNRP